MPGTTADLRIEGLRPFFERHGLELDERIEELRPLQWEALEWAEGSRKPYLFVNAPTGSGKTLILATFGLLAGGSWTYVVHTKRLQAQVQASFPSLPLFMGRGNFPCLIGMDTHGFDVTADKGICTLGQDCDYDGDSMEPCPYYAQRNDAMGSDYRVTNYALWLRYPPMKARTGVLLADEGHIVEQAVVDATRFYFSRRTLERFKLTLPDSRDLMDWVAWAKEARRSLPPARADRPDLGRIMLGRNLKVLVVLTSEDQGRWLIDPGKDGTELTPIWGTDFVMESLMGHKAPPPDASPFEQAEHRLAGVSKVMFTSATLMGAEYIADTLGLPRSSWDYLDLPSTFSVDHRPINYAPVMRMNKAKMATEAGRAKMQEAIDGLIEHYLRAGQPWGVVHSVSNKYRDDILRESRFRAIMTDSVEKHERRARDGEASVLVAANITEGWDGIDDLCRFILFPKVPYPSLGDTRTRIRRDDDPRSYDHRTLVAVVQGAGRGVRHRQDYADTWILDGMWGILWSKRRDWLPDSFTSAYHHRVRLPWR